MTRILIVVAIVLLPVNLGAQGALNRIEQIAIQPLPRHQAPLVPIGALVLNVTEQAEVYINGKFVGDTPFQDRLISLPPGDYNVAVKKEGYKPWAQKVDIPEDGEIRLTVSLQQKTGILIIRPNVAGTNIFIDGVLRETSLLREGIRFTPGEHMIRVTKRGFSPWERPVLVEEDKKLTLNLSLKKDLEKPLFRAPLREHPNTRSREEEKVLIFPSF